MKTHRDRQIERRERKSAPGTHNRVLEDLLVSNKITGEGNKNLN